MKSHTLTPAGTIGGHTLTVAQMPSHKHNLAYRKNQLTAGNGGPYIVDPGTADYWSKDTSCGATGGGGSHNHTFTGTQATINHMNPYEVAYCYKRIS